MRILAFLSDPPVVRKILAHLKLPADPPPLDTYGLDERDWARSDEGATWPDHSSHTDAKAARSPP